MSDDLEVFIADDADEHESQRWAWSEPLLLLSFGTALYGVRAACVENVMGYREPSRVPHGHPALAGILQDRGRMLALVRHPEAQTAAESRERPTRVVVCRTPLGRVGLPATQTHAIRTLHDSRVPAHRDVIDDAEGAVCFLDADRVAQELRGGGE